MNPKIGPKEALTELWQLYQQTVFITEQPLLRWESACIVTAFNPLGEVVSRKQNLEYDRQLVSELEQQQLLHLPILGASPDFTHSESSWLIQCSCEQGLEIAARFKQNAIYYIERGQLWLWPCLLKGLEPKELGLFERKVRG